MFQKNLDSISNTALVRRLQKISDIESRTGISYCVTPSNDYILLKDEMPIDDLQNPREAVQKILKNNIKNEMRSNDIIITFGLGLGYLLDETFNNYPSRIYIYEPDIQLLHFVLNNVDLSEHLSSGRVYVTNDLDELLSKLSSDFITKDRVEIVYLQNYAIVKNKELLMLTQKVFDTCKSKMVDVNTISKFSKVWLNNTIDNISFIQKNNAYLLSDLENKFIGQTALVAAAGPSLSDNIEKIKANRSKYVIFAVNKVAQYLFTNGITPDFVVCLDARNMERTLGGVNPKYADTNCIMDIRTDAFLNNFVFNKIFYNFSESDFFVKKLAKYNEKMRFYESGGSASVLALVSAVKMGFSKVILAGVDLAFKDNLIYANGDVMERISQEEILVDNVKKKLVQVKSVKGDMVYTREDYQTFIEHFNVIIKDLNYSEIYNISSFGAAIEGVKNVNFDDVNLMTTASIQTQIQALETFKFNLQEFVQEEFFNINNIIMLLSKEVFSPALVSAIVKSVFVYQYLQSDILSVLQQNFDERLAEEFIEKTKVAIKEIVDLLQKLD